MKTKRAVRERDEHGPRHVTPAGRLTQTQAATILGITQARVSDIKRGKFAQFSLDLLVRLASKAGLEPRLKLAASAIGALKSENVQRQPSGKA